MEVLSPSPNKEDRFDFNRFSSSYLSAPSSPKRFGEAFYLSAPTSPSRFYAQFEDDEDDGFAFQVNKEQDSSPRSAGELFDDGIIRPLESVNSPLLSPIRVKQSPITKGKKTIINAFSSKNDLPTGNSIPERRGRDRRTPSSEFSTSKSGRRIIRSDSPGRKPQYTWIEQQQHQRELEQKQSKQSVESVPTSHSWRSSRIWRLKDFLLFRSASEGRGTSKDPFRKFPVSYSKKSSEEAKEGKGSSPLRLNIPKSRRKESNVSAHELHYNRKKAENEDLKKKTFLPYKQGILGKLAGLGSSTR